MAEAIKLIGEINERLHAVEYSLTSFLYLVSGDGGNHRVEEWCVPGHFLAKYDKVTETLSITAPEKGALTVEVKKHQLQRGYIKINKVLTKQRKK